MTAFFNPAVVTDISRQAGFEIVEAATLPPRRPSFSPPPSFLNPSIRASLSAKFPDGIYAHQATALEAFGNGADVCGSNTLILAGIHQSISGDGE
jgi:ATP-dependent helicase YprA (DUF1998 family)